MELSEQQPGHPFCNNYLEFISNNHSAARAFKQLGSSYLLFGRAQLVFNCAEVLN